MDESACQLKINDICALPTGHFSSLFHILFLHIFLTFKVYNKSCEHSGIPHSHN
jgi:hypothetical protein